MRENLVNYASRFKVWSGESLALIMLSAPFVYIFMVFASLMTTDILLRSDVNGNTSKRSNVFSAPLILTVVVDWVDFMN